jgi:hypothetical protein
MYEVSLAELGIGDILCALYALNGFSLKRGRPPINLYLKDHFEWLGLVDIPNLRVRRIEEAGSAFHYRMEDTPEEYAAKLAEGPDWKDWYARKLEGDAPARPPLASRVGLERPIAASPYAVIAPFATRINRTWEIHHWRLLADALKAAGCHVVALDAPHQPERCKNAGVPYFYGYPPAWTADVCTHAALIVSNDSALAHLGGLLDRPTLVILAQQDPRSHFSGTRNVAVMPNHACAPCRFQPERGYEEKCDFGCWALQSISPRLVAQIALKMLSGAGAGLGDGATG